MDYQRQRQMTLGDLLLENRIVFLQGEIYDGNANELVMKLLYLQSENRRKDIHFYINSPGGSVTSTMAIYDTMQMLTCPVATYCVGLAASGGAILLAGGASGKRHCGQEVEKIAKDTDRDFYMDAAEAKEYGIVDDILTKPKSDEDEG
jgi:ATP-dependent Clp protease protease subunit